MQKPNYKLLTILFIFFFIVIFASIQIRIPNTKKTHLNPGIQNTPIKKSTSKKNNKANQGLINTNLSPQNKKTKPKKFSLNIWPENWPNEKKSSLNIELNTNNITNTQKESSNSINNNDNNNNYLASNNNAKDTLLSQLEKKLKDLFSKDKKETSNFKDKNITDSRKKNHANRQNNLDKTNQETKQTKNEEEKKISANYLEELFNPVNNNKNTQIKKLIKEYKTISAVFNPAYKIQNNLNSFINTLADMLNEEQKESSLQKKINIINTEIEKAIPQNSSPKFTAKIYNSIGNSYNLINTPKLAIISYKKSLKVDKKQPEIHLKKAENELLLNNIKQAKKDLINAKKNNGPIPDIEATKGLIQIAEGNYKQAEISLTKAITKDPDNTNYFRIRALTRQKLGRKKEAYSDYIKSKNKIKTNKREVDSKLLASSFPGLLSQKKTEKNNYPLSGYNKKLILPVFIFIMAISLLWLTKKFLNNLHSKKNTPKKLSKKQSNALLVKITKISVQINNHPTDYLLYKKRASYYEELGNIEKLINDYKIILQIRPDYILGMKKLFNLYYGLGRYEEAYLAILAVPKYNPEDILAYKDIGLVCDQMAKYEEAIQAFKLINKLYPKFKNIYHEHEIVLIDLERYLDLVKKEKLANNKQDSLYYHGLRKHTIGDWQGTVYYLNEVIKLNPANKEAYYYRGLAKKFLKDYLGADEDLARA